MKLAIIVLFATVLNALEGAPEGTRAPELEGTLRIHSKYLYHYYLDGFGDGQSCALRGFERFAKGIAPGSRIRVTGPLGVARHEGGTEDNPSPFPATSYIYMEVGAVEVLGTPDSDVTVAVTLARQLATEIEALKPRFRHLEKFDAKIHLQPNGVRVGLPPGSPGNPELATIAYTNGILGERPLAPLVKGQAAKRSPETIYDPDKGIQLYLHVFKGDSRGADSTPPYRVGDLSIHLSVAGPAKETLEAELRRVIDRVTEGE